MSDFYAELDALLGDQQDLTDIRVTARRCWFYDFNGYPLRVWQGQGKMFDSLGNEWLGTITPGGNDLHQTPAIQDGRDGTSASYSFSLVIPDIPGQFAYELYDALKADQWRVNRRTLTCYLALFLEGEGMRPATPLTFFKELTMMSTKFSEGIEQDGNGTLVRKYKATVVTKDGNFGRWNIPNGTYADPIQKERAKQQGVAVDRGAEFLAGLANRTYQLPK